MYAVTGRFRRGFRSSPADRANRATALLLTIPITGIGGGKKVAIKVGRLKTRPEQIIWTLGTKHLNVTEHAQLSERVYLTFVYLCTCASFVPNALTRFDFYA